MKFSCKFAILGLLIILLSNEINPSNAELETRKVQETALKYLQELMKYIPDPTGKVLSTVSGIFFSFYTTIQDANNQTVKPPSDNFLSAQKQQERFDRIESLIHTESQRVIDEIVSAIVGERIVNGLQKKVNFFKGYYDDRLTRCLLNSSCSSAFEKFDKDELLDRNKDYRKELKAFVEDSVAIRTETSPIRKIKSIFDFIDDEHQLHKKKNTDCNNNESEHQKIFHLSMVIMAVIAKSYSVVMAAHLRSYNEAVEKKNDKHAADYMTSAMDRMNEYQRDIKAVVTASHRAFNATSRDIRTCDPPEHIRGKTWERLTKLIIMERVELRKGGMKVFDNPRKKHAPLNMFCSIFKKYINANTAYRNLSDPERKFHHFAYEKEKFWSSDMYTVEEWGKAGDENVKKSLTRIYAKNHDFIDQHMCWVEQEDEQDSIRKFSTKNVTASPGFVITGVKWLIKNKTVYMEIQEGKYVNGSIDSSTINWKTTPEDYTQTATLNITHRSIALNDVILPPNAILTGVQFEFVEGVIFLRAEGLETNINGDQLTDKKISVSSIYLNAQYEVKYGEPDVSELAPKNVQHQVLRNTTNLYLPFQPTSFEKDAAQTMIPYFDIQPVFTTPPSPMGGIGMYYKSMEGFGGFAALKLMTADVTHKLDEKLIDNVFNQVNNIFKTYLGYDGSTSVEPSYK